MNLLDLLIVALVLAVAARGVASGFLRQAGSLGGFLLGLILGALVGPWVASAVPNGGSHALVAVLVFFGVALIVGGLGETLGYYLSGLAERFRLRALDSTLGAVFGVIITLVSIWLLASTFARSAGPTLATQIQTSSVLQTLNRTLPPAPDVMSRLERTLGVNGIPRVFTGLEPTPPAPVTGPNAAAVNAAVAAAQGATVKIEGLGCGGSVEGSGFVAGPGLVATNAHVVAGIDNPVVEDANGAHRAQVVVFDPNLDFAVLRTTDLAAGPLSIASGTEPRGTIGAALGYPGDGDFTATAAAILDSQTAVGRNIYDTGLIRRQIYELQAVVRPGNSGGPLVMPNGTVIGVVFAMSSTNSDIGYALTSAEILPDLQSAPGSGPVSTGACAAE